jgi:hypothetical protein
MQRQKNGHEMHETGLSRYVLLNSLFKDATSWHWTHKGYFFGKHCRTMGCFLKMASDRVANFDDFDLSFLDIQSKK